MEIVRVGIYLENKSFADALARALARECKTMSFFLISDFDEGKECEIILSTYESIDKRVIFLTRDDSSENFYNSPPYKLFMYKESHQMANDILLIYFQMTGNIVEYRGSNKCRIIVFAEESGGAGATSIAINTGKMLHRLYGFSCLYLNLCPIDDSRKYFDGESEETLLKLLYYLDTDKDFPLESFISEGENIDCINTMAINTYFNDIKPSIMNKLLTKLEKMGKYNGLIIDVGNHFSRENKRMIQNSDTTILIKNERNKLPEKFYVKLEKKIEEYASSTRIINVINHANDDWSPAMKEGFYIYEQTDLNLDKNYGSEIAVIAKKIVEGDY